MSMKPGFYTIMAAQFFSSLADNALLIAAIALLIHLDSPEWMTPMLKLFFVVSYVVLAAFVGAFADSMPKGRVMLVTNGIKIAGCLAMLAGLHPLLAYAIVGFGAAAYSPAKYGILTELLPPERLVAANGWIEGLTVTSIIFGTVLGGALIRPEIASYMLHIDIPFLETHIDTAAEAAIALIAFIYGIATLLNFYIPGTGAIYPRQHTHPLHLMSAFVRCCGTLWRDKLGQISLGVTTLFWGAGATLQFIVLRWAEHALGLDLSQGAILQAVFAVGVAAGAILAATRVPLKKSLSILPVGVGMGLVVMIMAFLDKDLADGAAIHLVGLNLPIYLVVACFFLVVVGGLAGFFVVPMNALLQHRGHVLMSAGHSIAVQNFNENLSVLTMLCVYAVLIHNNFDIRNIIILFGIFVAATMLLIMRRHQLNQREFNSVALIGQARH